jgi:hypothetical protein
MKNPLPQVTIQYVNNSPTQRNAVRFSIQVSEPQRSALKEALEETRDSVFQADEIELDADGITLSGLKSFHIVHGRAWSQVMARIGSSSFCGAAAIKILKQAGGDFDDVLADEAIERLKAGKTSFEELRDENPYLFEIPRFARFLSMEYVTRKNLGPGRGRPQNYTADQLNLYHYVCAHRRNKQSTLDACKKTVKEHPDLVPAKWEKNGEPHEALRKLVLRLDSHSRFSQKLDE